VVGPIAAKVDSLVTKTAGLRAGESESLDVALDLPSGVRLSGTVPGVYGDRVVRVVYSRLGAKHRLRAWVYFLALVSAFPGRDWAAATVGRGRADPTMSCLVAPQPDEARAVLDALVQIYRAGQCEPLPLTPKASCAYAEKRRSGSPVKASQVKAAGEWRRRFDDRMIGDFDDAEHRRVWGDVELDVLLAQPARSDLPWVEEASRFGQLARAVWDPLLSAETVVT
jgi:exodeoxyribonuclease V gamma subunit